MKFTCTQENLAQGLGVVAHIATKSANLPILNNILLRADKGGIELSATNLEIGITKRIRGKIETEGALTLPARVFAEYVSLLSDEKVEVEQDGSSLLIRSGNAETKLHGLPAEEFPLIPAIEQQNTFVCAARDVRDGIGQVVFAAASDDTRPEISGVFFRLSAKELTLAATDSYRLAQKRVPVHQGNADGVTAIVPVRTLQEVMRTLHQEGETVTFSVTANQLLCSFADTTLISRLVDGQYPDYQQILPAGNATTVKTDTAELLRAVRATSLFSRPGMNDLVFTTEPKEHRLTLHAANAQVGENRQHVNAEIAGEENTIVLNSRYVLDGLNALQSETTLFALTNNTSPALLQPEGDASYLYLVMPIKQ